MVRLTRVKTRECRQKKTNRKAKAGIQNSVNKQKGQTQVRQAKHIDRGQEAEVTQHNILATETEEDEAAYTLRTN